VRWLADEFGRRFGRPPVFAGSEAPTGWVTSAARMVAEFGALRVPLSTMIDWQADWLARGGATLGKPTHYDVRDGRY